MSCIRTVFGVGSKYADTHPVRGGEESVDGGDLVDEGQVDVEGVDGGPRGLREGAHVLEGVSVVEELHPVRDALHHSDSVEATSQFSGHRTRTRNNSAVSLLSSLATH